MLDGWVEWRSVSCPKRPPNPPKTCNFGAPKPAIWGISGAPVAVPIPAQNDPQTHSKFAISGAPNQQFWRGLGGSRRSGGGLGGSWGVPGGPGGLPGGSRGRPGGLLGASREAPGGLGESLGGSWAVPGGPWGLLEGVPGGPEGVPGGSRGVLGGSWKGSRGVWGRSWGPRTPRKLILDRFGADVGWNSAPGTTENCSFPLGFC